MNLMDKIAQCLQKGGVVHESVSDMHVLCYFDNVWSKYVILGDLETKHLYLQINEAEFDDWCFGFYDQDGEEFIFRE